MAIEVRFRSTVPRSVSTMVRSYIQMTRPALRADTPAPSITTDHQSAHTDEDDSPNDRPKAVLGRASFLADIPGPRVTVIAVRAARPRTAQYEVYAIKPVGRQPGCARDSPAGRQSKLTRTAHRRVGIMSALASLLSMLAFRARTPCFSSARRSEREDRRSQE
jgi:hypothetical protein